MTQDYQGQQAPQPPVPPDELLEEWRRGYGYQELWGAELLCQTTLRYIATSATTWAWEQAMATLATREQAAADAQLDWCCSWLAPLNHALARDLRAARRPKPPTLAEQALAAQERMWAGSSTHDDWKNVRAALLRLQELEQAASN